MFKKVKSKPNQQSGSRESVASSGNLAGGSSNENLTSSKDGKDAVEKVLHQKIPFQVYYLGMVQKLHMGTSLKRDAEAQLIDQVEEAQIEGKLSVTPREEDKVIINVSRHGIKVLEVTGQEILQRHPLHTLAQVIQYDDGFRRQNIALKIGQVARNVFNCYVFQCHSEHQAQAVCQAVRRVFDAINMKTR